jgi:hypothetical protein
MGIKREWFTLVNLLIYANGHQTSTRLSPRTPPMRSKHCLFKIHFIEQKLTPDFLPRMRTSLVHRRDSSTIANATQVHEYLQFPDCRAIRRPTADERVW